MTSISVRQNIFKRSIHELFESLNKYKQLIAAFRCNVNRQPIQTQFKLKMAFNQGQKIFDDLLGVYLYLEDKEEHQIKNLLQQFIKIFKDLNELFRQLNKDKKAIEPAKFSNATMCLKCKSLTQKVKLNKIKQSFGFTEGSINRQAQLALIDSYQLKKFSPISESYDDYQQKQKLHISNLETHISTLMGIIQSQYQSKTLTVLSKQTQTLKSAQTDFKQQASVIKQNQKTFMEAQLFYQNFNQNFMKSIKGPIQSIVRKLLKNIQQKRLQQQNSLLKPAETQTFISHQNQSQSYYEKKYQQLQNEMKKIRSHKIEYDRHTLKSVEIENQLKKQLHMAQQSKLLLEERFKQAQQNFNFLEGKLQVQITIKGKQIARLEKQISDLKQKLIDKGTTPKIQGTIPSKKSIISSKGKSAMMSKREVDRQMKSNFNNSRPSLDFSIDADQMQNNALIRFSNKKQQEKRIVRNSKVISPEEYKKIIKTSVQFKEDSPAHRQNQQFSQISQQKNLSIHTQIDIKIQPFTQTNKEQSSRKNYLKVPKSYRNENNRNLLLNLTNQSNANLLVNKNEGLNKTLNDTSQPIKCNQSTKDAQLQQQKSRKIIIPTNNSYRVQVQRFHTQSEKQNKKHKLIFNTSGSSNNLKTAKNGKRKDVKKQDNNCISLLPDIKQEYLSLFGGDKHAHQFQKNIGIWPHLVNTDKLMVDCENSNFATQIQKYFLLLHENKDPKIADYLTFLLQPNTYFAKIKCKELQKINPSEFDLCNIKMLFVQLIRFHKLLHRNCNHVFEFLDSIGFFLA